MTKCFTDSNCESEHVGHGGLLHAIKGFDGPQGLVCLLDGHWGRVFDRNPYSGRQSLDDFYGYEYVSIDSPSISELQAFSRPADAEWKWVLYQQQALPSDLLTPIKFMDRYVPNMVVDLDNNVKGDVKNVTAELSFASVLCAASKVEECPHAGISRPRRVRMIQSLESNAAVSSLKGTLTWHAANSKDFAATIPLRGHAYPENCDLSLLTASSKEFTATISPKGHACTESYDSSPLTSSLTWGEDCLANGCADFAATIPQRAHVYAENCDLPHLTANGKEFAATISHKDNAYAECYDLPPLTSSLIWGEDSVTNSCSLEGKLTVNMLSSTRGIQDLAPSCELLSGVMEPSVIPTILQQPSIQDRSAYHFDDEMTVWKASNEKCFDAEKQADDILGEALCRAQTRARLAEKLAAQTLQERDRLAHLLLKEAWTTCTYKQRAQNLELENRLLKLWSNVDIEVWTGSKSMFPVEQRARISRKLALKHHSRLDKRNLRVSTSWRDKDGNSSRSWKKRVLLSCTLGLAFVLGLSIAGAGLLIGWSMGWMLFS